MDSIYLPLGLFAAGALVGLAMAARFFSGKTPPVLMPILHGAFVVSAVVTLFLAVRAGGLSQYATYALYIFLAAALGGLYLVSFHFRGKAPPNAVIVIHALVAVTGFGLLAATAFGLLV